MYLPRIAMPVFGNIQPDALILEVGLFAIFLTAGSRIIIWLFRWLLLVDLAVIWKRIEQRPLPGPLATLVATTSRFGVTNYYGFFGVMNTMRREVVVEGSLDGEHWRAGP